MTDPISTLVAQAKEARAHWRRTMLGTRMAAALTALIEALESRPLAGEWIPVGERLPENERYVMVATSNGSVFEGALVGKIWLMASGIRVYEPTHWQEKPAHPNRESK